MKVRSAKNKGGRLQKWVAEKVCEVLDIKYTTDDNSLVYSRPASMNGVDVVIREEVLSEFPFSIECKNQEKWSVQSAIEQAKRNILPTTDWMVFFKKNRMEPVVLMDASVFFKLYKRMSKK